MKLLIVDDQVSAAQGIATRIDWAREGFDQVAVAKNAMEARLSFRERAPDVMLCDIEMPVESGLELCGWVVEQKFPTQIVILTCHPQFEYAQESIKLHIADFLVQPTPYDNILKTVRRVAGKLREESANKQKLAEYEQNLPTMRAGLWGQYLRGDEAIHVQELKNLMRSGVERVRVVMFHIVRWSTMSGQWQGDLMRWAIKNFLQDVFKLSPDDAVVAYIEPDVYAAVLFPPELGDTQTAGQSLEYICDIFKMYMPCTVAIYPSEAVPVGGTREAWSELKRRRQRNVTMRPGVYLEARTRGLPQTDITARWKALLQGYDLGKMAREATAFIDSLTESGQMDNDVLRKLYWTFIRFLSGSEWSGGSMEDIMQDEAASGLCRNAMSSVEDLKRFIQYIRDSSPDTESDGYEKQLINFVKQYVREHIEEDLRVETVAAELHIGADSLTRIFRKEMNCTVKNYIIQQKMLEAKRLLRSTTLPVSVVAAKLGYLNFSHFSSSYKKVLGYPPSEERGK